jgi:CheY-like chemotaxis protein
MARVLIVDDSWLTRRMLVKILNANGYEPIEAVNGIEALEKIQECKPECILLDLVMPECDGVDFLRTYEAAADKVPVIILTADIQDTTRKRCLELGATAVLHKPPREDEILSHLAKFLGTGE